MKPIVVVGGGLAGLTLGVGLRQVGVPVTLFESGSYPRHRVCGEFINGRGQDVLHCLDLDGPRILRDVQLAHTTAFCRSGATRIHSVLTRPAWCLSRFVLDQRLAREFLRLGGQLRERERWTDSFDGDGVVRATGRRSVTSIGGWRYFGLKAHARGVRLESDLEMHLVPGGYVGLCRNAPDTVNVCGMFRSRTAEPDLAARWREWLRGPDGSPLRLRLAAAEFLQESFVSVAGLMLRPDRAASCGQCRIGDCLTMIPPVTGNGMSMAFESAGMAIEPLTAYSRGDCSWAEACQETGRSCDNAFSRRLTWARLLQAGIVQPPILKSMWWTANRWSGLWQWGYARTR